MLNILLNFYCVENISCRKEEISAPCGCSRDTFSKSSLKKKYSSIPIGWILRLERRGCWFESGLLYYLVRWYNG